MAASNSPCPPSPSESDSDREPNSHGARVFWGNLKTPEKSRSAFVDPPQTVVRTQRALHIPSTGKSPGLSSSMQDNRSSANPLRMVEEGDEPLDPAPSDNNIMAEIAQTQRQYDVTHPHSPCSSNDGNDTTDQVDTSAGLSYTRTVSPQLRITKMQSLELGSESDVEREPVLQPSSPVDTLSSLDVYAQPSEAACQLATHIAVSRFTESVITAGPRGPRASELPDLISFDMPPPLLPLPNFQSHTSSHSSLMPSSQLSSSSATVDDLLTLSPIQSKSPLLQAQVLQAQSTILDQDAASLFTPPPEASHQKDVSRESEGYLSEIAVDIDPAPIQMISTTSSPPSENDIGDLPLQLDATTSNSSKDMCTAQPSTAEDGPATPSLKVPDAAARYTSQQVVKSPPSSSRGETRKRFLAKSLKGKEKAHDCDNSLNGSSNNAFSNSLSLLGDGESASDKAAKRERRAKAKGEAEQGRQQLLSLSPTSANVLSLLASPGGDSLDIPIGLDETISDFPMDLDPLNGPIPAEPETPRINVARRVPISSSSPQRSAGSPLRFITPDPINLDDPSRTPARRILLPSGAQTPCALPLDDPNRTPARRVAIQPSPSRPPKPTEPPASRTRIEESSPVKQTMPPSVKSSAQPTSSNSNDKTASSSSSLSPAIGISRSLPFPIRQNVAGEATTGTSVRTSRPNPDSRTSKLHAASNLRQPSSISTSKIARIATKPYSRTAQGPSRLPVISFMRGLGPLAPASSVSTSISAGPSRPHPAPANPVPSRIPSPSKRPIPPVKPINPPVTMQASDANGAEEKARVITAYKRKRQRMISEDDPDEPSAKRAVIMVRPVIKGMYNTVPANPTASELATIQREASPVHPIRPPGPIQVRSVIPGTLRHFETTRSSSRDLLDDSGQDSNPDPQLAAAESSDSESRDESPLVGADTASAVTTLSREPTLEELLDISGPRSETPVQSESVSELRRTTRVRKHYGPDALGLPSTSRATLRRDPTPLTRTTSMVQGEGALCSKSSSRFTTRTGAPQEGLPFNPRQLQALTDANTLRNQTYLADLQRKVVRRYGPRPGSPSTKIRTVMEKSREERSRGREARAERRRRREQGSNMSVSSEGDDMDILSSPTPAKGPSENGPLTKHARGPGDEEDYETPARPPPTNNADPNKVAKTVKWDRGLARTISDWAAEQKLANKTRKEAIRKGCLIRDRATLDPLGNVPDANEPLEDLERERIVVTRFVYDDDVEASRMIKRKS